MNKLEVAICDLKLGRCQIFTYGFFRAWHAYAFLNLEERFQIVFETLDQLLTVESKPKKKEIGKGGHYKNINF